MAAPSCILPSVSRAFATKVVNRLTDEQLDSFGISTDDRKEDAIRNVGYYYLEDEAFAYIPEAGLNLAEAFAKVGMAEVVQYKLTYADGKVEYKYAEEIPGIVLAADSKLVTVEAQ